MRTIPRHAQIALALAALLPLYFAVAALGTKAGLWGWRTGLGTLTVTWGPILLGAVALFAVVSLVACLVRKPRRGWIFPAIALAIPLALFAGLVAIRGRAAAIPPIHDISTDLSDPPRFSNVILAAREAASANPLNPYRTPLGQLPPWEKADPAVASRSHAETIARSYPDLAPLPMGTARRETAARAAADAMRDMGMRGVTVDEASGRIEGTAETFWFGFEDDVVVRVGAKEIDFRSVSRVGLSDLGANAARIRKLRAEVAERLAN